MIVITPGHTLLNLLLHMRAGRYFETLQNVKFSILQFLVGRSLKYRSLK